MPVPKIKNANVLATSTLRHAALSIAEAGLQAIDTKMAIKENVILGPETLTIKGKIYKLAEIKRIFVAGVGKCSLDAAEELEELLGDKIYKGMVIDIRCNENLKYIKSCEGDHPFPSQRNVDLTTEMIDLLKEVGEGDLVILIISGGGSTILCNPVNFTCFDESNILQCLFRGGATIQEINTVRKHLSIARGGFLAKHTYPAKVVSLIFSDVVGNDLNYIASGPTVMDKTTIEDAKAIIDKYFVAERAGFDPNYLIETPKEPKYFENITNVMLVSNMVGLLAMEDKARELGFNPKICDSCLVGEATIVGTRLIDDLHKQGRKAVQLYGGETIVKIRGTGRGGRNQEMTLSALRGIRDGECFLTIASDGRDNTDAAGAICDMMLRGKAKEKNLEPDTFLAENNSFAFFEAVGGTISTGGATGSNTADFTIALKE